MNGRCNVNILRPNSTHPGAAQPLIRKANQCPCVLLVAFCFLEFNERIDDDDFLIPVVCTHHHTQQTVKQRVNGRHLIDTITRSMKREMQNK